MSWEDILKDKVPTFEETGAFDGPFEEDNLPPEVKKKIEEIIHQITPHWEALYDSFPAFGRTTKYTLTKEQWIDSQEKDLKAKLEKLHSERTWKGE